jgi:hypothetical protein
MIPSNTQANRDIYKRTPLLTNDQERCMQERSARVYATKPGPPRTGPLWARHITIIIAAAIATRLITFGNPILYTDEEFYFAVGRSMINGALPFVDIWDRKPIGLFLLYAAPAALPLAWGIWLYQGMALACAAATALIIARLADAAGWTRGATLAGIAYLAWITVAGGQGGQSPVFYNLMMASAALLMIDPSRAPRRREAIAMLLVGVAIQIKYTAALEGIYFGIWLMFNEWQRRKTVGAVVARGVLLAGIALLPTIVAIGAYAYMGALPAFMFANFQSIFARNADPTSEQLANLAKAIAILLPLLVMAAGSRTPERERVAGSRIFLVGWLVAALLAFALLPPWTDHYTLPVMLPGAAVASGFLTRPRGRVIGIGLVMIAVMAGQISLIVDRQRRGTPAEFAQLVQAVGRGPGCLYVYSSTSMLYPASGRCAVSRYVFPSHLTREREDGAIGVHQMTELRSIFARAPAVVVMGPPLDGERPDIRAAALALLARDYRLTTRQRLGRKAIAVYLRRIPAAANGELNRFD